jgi:hypothetical protein
LPVRHHLVGRTAHAWVVFANGADWHGPCVAGRLEVVASMLPTSAVPLSPVAGPAGFGMLLAVLAIGAFAALVLGWVLHRREQAKGTIDVAERAADAAPDRTRLSA